MYKKAVVCSYTPEGRTEIHKSQGINMDILHMLMRSSETYSSIEFVDNRISLYAAQYGCCAVTGMVLDFGDIHCHHIVPVHLGGTDKYQNLVIVHAEIHKLIHATQKDTIEAYLEKFDLSKDMLKKLNHLREKAQLETIA